MPRPGSASGKGLVLSRDEQWRMHNKNSPQNVDLTAEERQERKNNLLRSCGVAEEELILLHEIPEDRRGQGFVIDTMITESNVIINNLGHQRRTYYHLKIFGKGTPQAEGNMKAINELCEDVLKPDLEALQERIKQLEGRPLYPPPCFAVPLNELKVPVPPKGKRK